MNYAGVATNNFAMDELVHVSGGAPPAKAKAKAAPKPAPVAAKAPPAKAENVSKFSLVNLFEESGPKYSYDASGAIAI